jgi:hypothetical protein
MMHSGYNAVVAGADCSGREPDQRIHPHAWAGCVDCWKSKDGSVQLNGHTYNSVYNGGCDTDGPTKPGLMTHEFSKL